MNRSVSAKNDIQHTPLSRWARLIYLFVAVNALAGAVILMFLPGQTGALFFWPVNPAINAGLFGALYLGGAAVVFWAAARNLWEPSRFLVPILVTAGHYRRHPVALRQFCRRRACCLLVGCLYWRTTTGVVGLRTSGAKRS